MNDIVTLKMPFRFGKVFFREKNVDFIFRIGTLEDALDNYLNCSFEEISTRNPQDVLMSLLFAGYITACQKRYRKPKYNFNHAFFWVNNMNKESNELFLKAINDLFGKYKKEEKIEDTEEKKK